MAAILSRAQQHGDSERTIRGGAGKAIIFFSACASVDYHFDLFADARWPSTNRVRRGPQRKVRHYPGPRGGFVGLADNPADSDSEGPSSGSDDESSKMFGNVMLFKLHGNLTKEERSGFIQDFQRAPCGALLSSDVASRGLDIPRVDWIIQYDPPQRTEEYLHRVGRTARLGRAGNALLFLQPSELGFLDVLRQRGVTRIQKLDTEGLLNLLKLRGAPKELHRVRDLPALLSAEMARRVARKPPLMHLARGAFQAAARAYRVFPKELRAAFPISELHLGHLATSFALRETPGEISRLQNKGAQDTATEERHHTRKQKKRQRVATSTERGGIESARGSAAPRKTARPTAAARRGAVLDEFAC